MMKVSCFRCDSEAFRGGVRKFSGPVCGLAFGLLVALALLAPALTHDGARAAGRRADAADALALPLVVSWRATTNYYGNNAASPVVQGDSVYFASGNRLYAVSLQTGATRWQYPADSHLDVYVQTTPAIVNDTLFFSAGDSLYSLNILDGKQKFPPYRVRSGVVTSPIAIADTVYFGGGDGRIYAIDSKTGTTTTGVFKQGVPAGSDISSDLIFAGENFYYTSGGLDLSAMDVNSGRIRWTQRLPSATRDNVYPVITGDTLYIVSGNSLMSMRSNNGTQRWYVTLPNDASAPPAVDSQGNIYIITSERNIYALNHSGRGFWHQAPQVDFEVAAQPIISGSNLIVGTTQGTLYAFDLATGAKRWSYQVQPTALAATSVPSFTTIAAKPIIAGDALLVLTDDGTLTAFRHNAPDTLPPIISDLDPKLGEDLNGRPPLHFAAKILDEGSGINTASLTLKIDNQPISHRPEGTENQDKPGFTYDESTGQLEYYTLETETGQSNALTDGHHTVTISAKDWVGNTATKTWTFNVDSTLPSKTAKPNKTGRPGRGGGGGGAGGGGLGGAG